ncbi:single-stranded-DNA-specific exonuclease RecJ [Salibacterium halotolerans]|uniref:Single-stranded-DNA-specific exonuclease RecJ n=1 Tax=Salibacterium halotolerans TaxID=1884432 RepID=A0A1I5UE41_9BACI|nr:single-stranded-DNA-specific exonuclease RecJ [Salibacterium halotolerans]SFP93532.1 single-stranded-DNA-specific exonuclease [Salibacterium halotolerans]
MLRPKTRWMMEEADFSGKKQLEQELNVSSMTAALLSKRGYRTIKEASEFLKKPMDGLHDPFLLDGMQEAVERIHQAVDNKEKILIFGDYDADGVSSTIIMMHVLKELNADFGWYIPNRFTEGYGPNIPALEQAAKEGASLVITVDTGIAAVPEVKAANEMGLDVIVTDHHEPAPELPDAYCIINPKKPGCSYPFKELAGAGVALKTAEAALGSFPSHLLDIFTIGTISDLVPLLDENRILVSRGLQALAVSKKPGIEALKRICGIEEGAMEEDHVGFAMGPRINAAGRMEAADPAVHLLASKDKEEAGEWAKMIDGLNRERQKIVNDMTKEAVEEVENHYPPSQNRALVIARKGWSPGVIGIVASRLIEQFYRPVIVLGIDEETGEAKGSARSIQGFDMFSELSQSRDILPHFGGHTMAAGLTMDPGDIDELRRRLEEQAAVSLEEDDFIPSTTVDMKVAVSDVTTTALEELQKLGPFGVGNPKPVFMLQDVTLASKRKIGSAKNHLKLELEQDGKRLDGVGFHLGSLDDYTTENASVRAVGELSINEWNGWRKPQLFLKDLAVDQWQLFDKRQQKDIKETVGRLPDAAAVVVSFHEENVRRLASMFPEKNVLSAQDVCSSPRQAPNLIFADMPIQMSDLNDCLAQLRDVENVYVFFRSDDVLYFQKDPGREDFKWYYGFLKKRGSFNLEKHGEELAQRKGWTYNTVSFMSHVFFELDFVTMESGIVQTKEAPAKRDLLDSVSYQKHRDKREAEQVLLYSTYTELKERLALFIQAAGGNNETKEKVGHGF